ncbi:MAG TPA: universal stress protein [Steroidobacteraceae bacterium]|nr:universal stress protein [Steroidobacteraceae bacterium]
MSWERILVAVGPKGIGPIELDKIGRIAAGSKAQVELFQCIQDPHMPRKAAGGAISAEDDVQGQTDDCYRALEEPAARLRGFGVPVHVNVRWDQPVHSGLIREVQRARADLIVCQSNPKKRAARWLLTQTDYKLIEKCPCSVLFIKTREPYGRPRIIAAVDPEPFDRAERRSAHELEDAIVGAATTLAGALAGEASLLSVTKPWSRLVEESVALESASPTVSEEMHAAYCETVRINLQALAQRHGIPGRRLAIVEGDAAEILPRVANHDGAQVMVMGVVSRSRVERMLIGHTAERVLDALYCDVLAVKLP